jgi:LPXTG-motif cell wall-anchored protein
MRRAIAMLITAALFVVVWASTAVAQTDYPLPPPAGPGAAAPGRAAAAGQLPRTGGSNTPSLVVIGIAALVVGLVLVLAVRRRRAVARGTI